ncbi:MAG: VOC family protein [Dehalococcoidia bacterium]|nr:VOC family protein [Dehalococcoidia bacterium]
MAGVDAQGHLQIAMNVKDIDRAVAFYRNVLGLPLLFQAGNLAFFDVNGVRLILDIPEDKRFDHPGSVLYLRVADIQAGHAALIAKGVAIEGEGPHIVDKDASMELWMTFFHDGKGNIHALASEVALAKGYLAVTSRGPCTNGSATTSAGWGVPSVSTITRRRSGGR